MKTVKKDSVVKRFDNETAERKVKNEGFHYTTKSVWKKDVRDVKKENIEIKKSISKKVK